MSRWQAWDARRGELGPWHVRFDSPNGKTVAWYRGGRRGLGDEYEIDDLVYADANVLAALARDPSGPVIVTEGEKACDAVRAAGLTAVATVCGAWSTPGPAVIALLAAWPIVLWPDHDVVGRAHMGRLGTLLEAAHVPVLSVIRPPADAPVGWDAADATPEQIQELAGFVWRWIGPVTA